MAIEIVDFPINSMGGSFHSYVKLPEGISQIIPIKPPFSYGFPMVFLWFSYGFLQIIPIKSH